MRIYKKVFRHKKYVFFKKKIKRTKKISSFRNAPSSPMKCILDSIPFSNSRSDDKKKTERIVKHSIRFRLILLLCRLSILNISKIQHFESVLRASSSIKREMHTRLPSYASLESYFENCEKKKNPIK